MSEEKGSEKPKEKAIDPKAKFREALDKKKRVKGVSQSNVDSNSKILRDQSGIGGTRIFRRKSGSA